MHPAVSEICVPQSMDPICGKFYKFLAHGQAHVGQMGKWQDQCTTKGPKNSIELRMEKIRQAVTEIWVPQVWQPPARPPARTVTTIPLQPEELRGKNSNYTNKNQSHTHIHTYIHTYACMDACMHAYTNTYFCLILILALVQRSDFKSIVDFLWWDQDSNWGVSIPIHQQTVCPLTNRLSHRGSNQKLKLVSLSVW